MKNDSLLPMLKTVEDEDADPDDRSEEAAEEGESSIYRDPPEGHWRMRPSAFRGLPASVFFEYPPELGLQREDESYLEPTGDARVLEYSCHWERNCIKNAFRRAGFVRSSIGSLSRWTALWGKHSQMTDIKEYNCFRKVNHFPSSWCLGRKDRLARTMQKMKRMHGSPFDFHPLGFVLPVERPLLLKYMAANSETKNYWIVKPVASSCGKGIRLMEEAEIRALPPKKKVIVQKYLENPYLIDMRGASYKFDLRIYVLLSRVDPMLVYVYKEGLVRIATKEYSLANTKSKFSHLTNFSVNIKNKEFILPEVRAKSSSDDAAIISDTDSSKWSLATFKTWLAARTSDAEVDATFKRINDLLVKTMIAGEGEMSSAYHHSAPYNSNCYELFGCDVFLDESLTPSLIEVNVSPSLTGSTPIDKLIKGKLLADTFHLVGFYPHDPVQMRRYSSITSTGGKDGVNVFGWKSMSVLLAEQEEWRALQLPDSIDMDTVLASQENVCQLLMIEDELSRARSTDFELVHPVRETLLSYLKLYRSPKFADHLLARWLLSGGSGGIYASKVAAYVLDDSTVNASSQVKTIVAKSGRRLSINIDGKVDPRIRHSKTEDASSCADRGAERRSSLEALSRSNASRQSASVVDAVLSRTHSKRARSTPPMLPRLAIPNLVNLSPGIDVREKKRP